MAHPENTFIAAVHRHLPLPVNNRRHNPYWMKNNNIYTAGVWDVWYSGEMSDWWIEYKFEVLPKRDTTMVPIDLSPLQFDWGSERYAEGRNLAVIVGSKDGGVLLLDKEWERKEMPKSEFMSRIWSRQKLATWIMGQTNK